MSVATVALDRYIAGSSAIHRADPRLKTGLIVVFIIALTSLPVGEWWFMGGFFLIVWAAALASQVGPLRIFRRTFIALPFFMVAVPSVFTRGSDTLATWDFGAFTTTPTSEGLEFLATITLKSWIAVTAAVLLSTTTRYMDVVAALRWFRVPELLLAVMAMMYRYLFLLIGEAQRMIMARRSRSAVIEGHKAGGTVRWRARVVGHMAGSLFVRTFDRSERVYMAMLARGYSGAMLPPGQSAITATSAALFVLLAAALAGVAVTARFV